MGMRGLFADGESETLARAIRTMGWEGCQCHMPSVTCTAISSAPLGRSADNAQMDTVWRGVFVPCDDADVVEMTEIAADRSTLAAVVVGDDGNTVGDRHTFRMVLRTE